MKLVGCGFSLLMLATVAQAETLYVSDKLVVSVYAEANQESERLATLDSGDSVEALEKVEGYTRVKLQDAREGWIRSNYLSAQVPAIVRVKELEKERASATAAIPAAVGEEIKALKEQNASLRSELQGLKQAAQTVSTAAPALASPPAAAESRSQQPPLWKSSDQVMSFGRFTIWLSAGVLVGALLGFAFGYRSLAKKIERKYGKLRIY
jgi:SH3 domain protein